jgi:hypothetical protein
MLMMQQHTIFIRIHLLTVTLCLALTRLLIADDLFLIFTHCTFTHCTFTP